MALTVKRDDDKVWLDGINGFSCKEYASSVHGSQALVLQALGDPVTYADLICYGGFAFRVNMHDQMCPSSGHPFCGYDCGRPSFAAIPRQTTSFDGVPWGEKRDEAAQQAFEAEAHAAIKASIDGGVPVHYGSEEDGIIIGCADDGRRWYCLHPYHKNGSEAFWHDEVEGFAGGKWPWGIVVYGEPVAEVPSTRDLTLKAFRQAVDMWNTEKEGAYFCGHAAYAHWLGWLRGVEAGTVEDPKGGMQGNGWAFDVLQHSRRIAASWVRDKAASHHGSIAAHLREAADHYQAIADTLTEGLENTWQLAPAPSKADEWTSDMRQDQIRRLVAAQEHDRAAIAALERVLAEVAAE